MELEEYVDTYIRLYVVNESSHTEVPDLYTTETKDWHHKIPKYFSSQKVAEEYKNYRRIDFIAQGYCEFHKGDGFYSKNNDCLIINIATANMKAKKDQIMSIKDRMYFFDGIKTMHEIFSDAKMAAEVKDG